MRLSHLTCILLPLACVRGEHNSGATHHSWLETRQAALEAFSALRTLQQTPTRVRLEVESTFADIVSVDPSFAQSSSVKPPAVRAHTTTSEGGPLPKPSTSADCFTGYGAQVEYLDKSSRQVFIDSDNREIVALWEAIFRAKSDSGWRIVRDASVADVVIVFRHGSFQTFEGASSSKTALISTLHSLPRGKAPPLSLLVARRQDQVRLANEYFGAYGCSWQSIGIHPESFFIEDVEQCRAVFSKQDVAERKRPWLVKEISRIDCMVRGSGCMYVNALPEVVVGTKGLRKRFGTCRGAGKGKVLERAVAAPLLVHSKRFKIHSFVLIASTLPWVVFVHPGIVSLAAKRSNEDSEVGSTVKDSEQLRQESTNVFNHRASSGEALWTYERFVRYLDTYEHCKIESTCQAVWKQVKDISTTIIEASLTKYKATSGRFQLFQMSFWLTESLQVVWSHGMEDVSLLYYVARLRGSSNAAYAQRLLSTAFDLAEAVQVFPRKHGNFSGVANRWELIKHAYWEEHCKPKAFSNPCFQAKMAKGSAAQDSNEKVMETNAQSAADEHDTVAEIVSVETDGQGQGLPSDTVMTSPAIKLDMKRRV